MTSRFLPWRGGEGGQGQAQQRTENYGHDRVRVPGNPTPQRHGQPNPSGRAVGDVVVAPASSRHILHSSLTVHPPQSPPSQLTAQRQPPSATPGATRRRPVSFSSNIVRYSPPPEDPETSDNAVIPLLSSDPSDDDMTMWCKKTSPTPSGSSKQTYAHKKTGSTSTVSNGTVTSVRRPSTSQGIVELPGSLLLDNEGFPSTDPAGNTRRARWGKGPEKVLPSLAASLGLEKPRSPEVNSLISTDGISIESTQSASTSNERTTGNSTPQSPTRTNSRDSPMSRDSPLRAPRNGQDYRMAQATTEAQRVGQVLARRVRDLETNLKERDESIVKITAELEAAQKAHAVELSKIKELHSTEILSLKTTFTRLETNEGFVRQGPLQISTIENTGRSGRRQLENNSDEPDLLKSWGTDLEQALKNSHSTEGSMPSTTVSEPHAKSEERIREELTLQFETRLDGERRRRKEVLERAQDLHQSREAELQEKLKSRDKRVMELESEVAMWKADIDQVEEKLQKFIGYYNQSENENLTNNREKKRLEGENEALKRTIAARDGMINNLIAEITELRLNSNRSGSDDNYQTGTIAPTVTATDPMARIKQLEDLVAFHVDDIRLYKLDCKGYKKDIKSRDTKITRLAQHIAELEKKLFITSTEHEDLQRLLREAGRTDFESVLQQNQQRYLEAYQRHSAKVLDDLAKARKGNPSTPPGPQPPNYHQPLPPTSAPSVNSHIRSPSAPRSNTSNHPSHSNPTTTTLTYPDSQPYLPEQELITPPVPPKYFPNLTNDPPTYSLSSTPNQPPLPQSRPLQPRSHTPNAPVSAVGWAPVGAVGLTPTPPPPMKDPRRDKPLPLPVGRLGAHRAGGEVDAYGDINGRAGSASSF